MITITLDSLPTCVELLKTINFNDNLIFLNDGINSHQVLSFTARTEDFEVNGTYQAFDIEYELELSGERVVHFQIDNGELKIKRLPVSLKNSDTIQDIPEEVSKYYF
ncbi:hypothetical protein [Vibrio marisflavi]|uniref:Uncharacterized protein n=1 Tax=Vibrio marisflavi CECT 7928 TaxID=634439 RepID=A0ABM9A4J5_9VIBR|nr:hypothetical protein [Vibrio marisflavi]CAH0539793.1 hypothetical protein VMF7928_02450 [Vibrio marisflavi CECT 7928]